MSKYSISDFIADAKSVLAGEEPLEAKKAAIAKCLSQLSRRDDLTRFGLPLGPADGSNENYLLYREPPHTTLLLTQYDPGYMSPVHEHGDYWVVGCGYRGRDRWDMYERLDDGSRPGYADLKLVDQIDVPPGECVWMPPPPRAIHSHNNQHNGHTMELLFSGAPPTPPSDRLIYDVEDKKCWPSSFDMTRWAIGDHFPKRPAPVSQMFAGLGKSLMRWTMSASCPVCVAMDSVRRPFKCEPALLRA